MATKTCADVALANQDASTGQSPLPPSPTGLPANLREQQREGVYPFLPSLTSTSRLTARQKKKCDETQPRCDRCQERGLDCEYEAVKPRRRRRSSIAASALARNADSDRWPGRFDRARIYCDGRTDDGASKWEMGSAYLYPGSDESVEWDVPCDNDVEEIVRTDLLPLTPDSPTAAVGRSRSQHPDLAMIAPSPVASPLLEFCAPVFEEFTDRTNRRALVHHFCNVLSHLIVFKEDTGNPFRQLVLPLSHASSPVMNAIFALSSAHMEYRGIENAEKSLDFHNKALQGLAHLIEKNDQSSREEVLGAIMLLVYYEVVSCSGPRQGQLLTGCSSCNEAARI